MNELQELFKEAQSAQGTEAVVWIAIRISLAAVLTTAVAGLYRYSRERDARQPGFAQTLVLLGPLIAMVTMAVGTNVAAAFTLVGTLAIVRFRYSVRDTRDMAYVIFSVAVGMALGSFNILVALIGVIIVGLVIVILRQAELDTPPDRSALLRIIITPPEADASLYEPTLASYGGTHSVVRSSIDRAAGQLDLRIAVSGVDPTRSPELLAALMEIPDIVRATFNSEGDS